MKISDLVGIPFDEYGDDLNGINCYNLLRKAFETEGIYVPPTNIAVCACKDASNKEIQDKIIEQWEEIKTPEKMCGVLIRSSNPNFADHIGTYLGNNRILHITMNTRSIIERMYPKFKGKVAGFYKFVG